MEAPTIIEETTNSILLQVKIELKGSMLEMESEIQDALNAVGVLATGRALKKFDTDGRGIVVNNQKYTVKYVTPEVYQTPHGTVEVNRHIYQHSAGGRTYCPMEDHARVVTTSTPRFARIISHKYGEMSALRLQKDLEESFNRKVTTSFIQNICEFVGTLLSVKESDWEYELPKLEEPVKTVTVGLDGTTLLMKSEEEGSPAYQYREAMVGTLGFHDKKGERLHTIYTAASPEYGKEKFLSSLKNEIENVKKKYPSLDYLGLADGAKCNWNFLEKHTDEQILDFYHASEYLTTAAEVLFKDLEKKKEWLNEACHSMKHEVGFAKRIIHQLEEKLKDLKNKKELQSVITYFKNNIHRMNYAEHIEKKHPIGSGITEAAAKSVVKQRLCKSGMKWKEKGASIVLSIRSLTLTEGRWQQAWKKIDEEGFMHAA